MKKEHAEKSLITEFMKGRTARGFAVAVSAFLCVLTLLEFTALELELEISVLMTVMGERNILGEEYAQEELALDVSTENELIVEKETKEAEIKPEEKAGEISSLNYIEEENTVDAKDTQETENSTETSEEENALPYYIRVNRKQNCITVYTLDESGEYTVPYKAMICSTGLYNATPRGTFQLSTKYRWRELYGGVYGQYATRIHGGVLFHSVPYYRKSENSLCTEKYNKLGQQASMGCVRLTVEDAKWISENCPEGTGVEIYEDDNPGPLGKPEAIKIDTDNPNKGWDPTDPSEDNPWNEVSTDN